jgi:uncharacterized protein (DUF4415 family)
MTIGRFEWDESKNVANQQKHGISFEDASEVFGDPLYVTMIDPTDGRHDVKGNIMSVKMVSYKLGELPPRTDADRTRLAALAARPDSEIDLSDIPELTEEDWKNAVRGKHYRPVKAQITASLDKDVLAWLKAGGRGYQTRMNAILRREMLQARASGSRG